MKVRFGIGYLAAALVFVVLATLNSAGYRYGASDQALYFPAVLRHGLPPQVTLNVNVPYGRKHRGVRLTHLAHRDSRAYALEQDAAHRGPAFWIREKIQMEKVGESSDHAAIRAGYISITPLTFDLPEPPALGALEDWIKIFPPLVVR